MSETWVPWFTLLGTHQLDVRESYYSLSYPWVDTAAANLAIQTWTSWTDFPLPDSIIYSASEFILLLHGASDQMEYLPRSCFLQHHILFWGPTACKSSLLPFSVSISHKAAGGFWMVPGHSNPTEHFNPSAQHQLRHPARSFIELQGLEQPTQALVKSLWI